jgi:phage N-6-adenine-methyltransferase
LNSGFTHDNVNNKSVDWYTPKVIFDSLDVEFDLDPCAPEGGVPWIPAKKHFSLKDDGLNQDWFGRVWLNPPYGRETGKWLKKMNEHRNGISLVFSRTDCAWFHDYVIKADAINFLKGRIKFVDGLGVTSNNGAGAGSMLIAWGKENVDAIKKLNGKTVYL